MVPTANEEGTVRWYKAGPSQDPVFDVVLLKNVSHLLHKNFYKALYMCSIICMLYAVHIQRPHIKQTSTYLTIFSLFF